MSRTALVALLVAFATSLCAAPAWADGPVGSDPPGNYPLGAMPSACYSAPDGATCQNAAISYLDQARASLGQPAYALPANFTSLTPAERAFVLTDLDRTLYGLPAIPGLTDALDSNAAAGVAGDQDPIPTDPNFTYFTSNWAGGYPNIEAAYEAWMYDDGPGSGNIDCTTSNPAGCWGHRHDVLWSFSGSGPLAMGAAAGSDGSGQPGYAMLLGIGTSAYQPVYTYTWAAAQAAAAGSGTGAGAGGSSPQSPPPHPAPPSAHGTTGKPLVAPRLRILHVTAARGTIHVAFTGSHVVCTLARRAGHRWRRVRTSRCTASVTYRHLRRGRYRFRVAAKARSAGVTVTLRRG